MLYSGPSSRGKIIGGIVGGVSSLVVLLVIFLSIRKRREKRMRDFDTTGLPHSLSAAPLGIDPYIMEKPLILSPNQKGLESSHHCLGHSEGEQNPNPDPPSDLHHGRESGGPSGEETNEAVNPVTQLAMQDQIRSLMQRVERIEAGEQPEAPPEYASAYGSGV
ncbi:hypothetical protein PQX77_005659 [Marasmius sp. AFHP31]|nr:hypothetical protein PQX77_005659 [Marasmius sp. AFHP31]